MEPGSVYVFDLPTDVSSVWLVVREHPDGGPLLLVLCDDSPFTGRCDVPLPSVWGPACAVAFARCNASVWCEPEDLARHQCAKVCDVTADDLAKVRRVLASLARGNAPPDTIGDNDPNYWELCRELERLGLHLSGGRVG